MPCCQAAQPQWFAAVMAEVLAQMQALMAAAMASMQATLEEGLQRVEDRLDALEASVGQVRRRLTALVECPLSVF